MADISQGLTVGMPWIPFSYAPLNIYNHNFARSLFQWVCEAEDFVLSTASNSNFGRSTRKTKTNGQMKGVSVASLYGLADHMLNHGSQLIVPGLYIEICKQ